MVIERTQYELVAECILSGQVSDREISDLTDTDPKFGEWFRARTSKRPSVTPSAPEEVDLISLAAWLHRQSKEAETAVAAVPGQHGKRRIREDAARLAPASAHPVQSQPTNPNRSRQSTVRLEIAFVRIEALAWTPIRSQ